MRELKVARKAKLTRRSKAVGKLKLVLTTLIVVFIALLSLQKMLMSEMVGKTNLREQIYSYMKVEKNQKAVFNSAISLNNGDSANSCVYFVAEVLRRNNVGISESTCNTAQLIEILRNKGWKKDSDYKNLKPGDIVFTTDGMGNKNGIPTHTYVFMDWVEEGSYDYAYICDNQAKDYDNKVYHIRNIKNPDSANGFTKDAFSFFMKP